MSVANLTRYTEFLRYDGHTSAALMAESSTGAYVKFEEAMVASSNSVQQLKAEIAALVQEHFLVSDCGVSYGHIGVFITKLRQLTAV